MFDLGLTLTLQAIRRQLAAMPCELYLVRLIHNLTKRPSRRTAVDFHSIGKPRNHPLSAGA
jgi:hypothetical protein